MAMLLETLRAREGSDLEIKMVIWSRMILTLSKIGMMKLDCYELRSNPESPKKNRSRNGRLTRAKTLNSQHVQISFAAINLCKDDWL